MIDRERPEKTSEKRSEREREIRDQRERDQRERDQRERPETRGRVRGDVGTHFRQAEQTLMENCSYFVADQNLYVYIKGM